MKQIEVASPGGVVGSMREELLAAFTDVLGSGSYVLGPNVEQFEREWALYCETAHAVGVASGTDALALALRAVGVEPGDEVLVPAMTATATWAAVAQIGATPVGVDMEPEGYGLDPRLAAAAVTSRTKALVVVHLFGQPANVESLAEVAADAGLQLVEDAAQAHGSSWHGRNAGSIGVAAAFSFYPTKNLGAIGDAGAVTTGDERVAARVRALRQYGWDAGRVARSQGGINGRLDELQAAFLRVALGRLANGNARRREIAAHYLKRLQGVHGLQLPTTVVESIPAWHQFVIRHPHRDELAEGLAGQGIGTAVHYACPPPLEPAFAHAPRPADGYPLAERHAAQALSLPIHPQLSDADVERVIEVLAAACAAF
jgi:dTDP-4-amino-4,6-dideoxygalactose transaminase